jgi:methionyl-tRNA formyltransferase
MRIAYFGTPTEAVPPLERLAGEHEVALVVTQPDRRRGRGVATSPSPVKAKAVELGLVVHTPQRAVEVVEPLRDAGAELGIVVAFGQLLPEELLSATPRGFVNVHFSLLPRWRGAAPVQRAILAGDHETGVCIMAMDAGLDTGPIYARRAVAIGPRDTAGELGARLVASGTELLLETLEHIDGLTPVPQVGEPVHAPKLSVDEFALDWSCPADELDRVVRAGTPRPGAWTTAGDVRIKVLRCEPLIEAGGREPGSIGTDAIVGTGRGGLRLVEVQPEGRRVMSGEAWLAGRRETPILLGR